MAAWRCTPLLSLPAFGAFGRTSHRQAHAIRAGQATATPRTSCKVVLRYIILSLDHHFPALLKISFTKLRPRSSLLAFSHRSRASFTHHYSSFLPVRTGYAFFVTQRVPSSSVPTKHNKDILHISTPTPPRASPTCTPTLIHLIGLIHT